MKRATQNGRHLDTAIRIDQWPAPVWLSLQALALAPTWIWMVRRLGDGSDDPLGLLAIGALAWLAWQQRHALRASPRLGWLALAMLGTLTATVAGLAALPPLAAGLVATLSVAAALLAFLPPSVAALPVAGLAVLALPLLSSLQFYAGYPLRVVTAEASRWLLAPAFSVLREGTSLLVDGRLVIVDAPCSGVQMVWLGYFCAFVVAHWARRTDRSLLTRLPFVGAVVLAGNVLRNAVLVAFEGAGQPLAPWAHQILGLVVLAAVCGCIGWVVARPPATATRRKSTRVVAITSSLSTNGARHAKLA